MECQLNAQNTKKIPEMLRKYVEEEHIYDFKCSPTCPDYMHQKLTTGIILWPQVLILHFNQNTISPDIEILERINTKNVLGEKA